MITVVSGLPRSGTSLVMQMLAAGGHPILCDHRRQADDDNPLGYLEYEPVKSLERDASWLAEAEGKAVKIISFLLTKLPVNREYRVIFLRRDVDEVLRSQAKMLTRRGQPAGPPDQVMHGYFTQHLQTVDHWLSQHAQIPVLNCNYAELVQNASEMTQQIAAFLNRPLDLERMASVVDPKLYRQRRDMV